MTSRTPRIDPQPFSGGDGSITNPYLITAPEQLAWLSEAIETDTHDHDNGNLFSEKSYKLANDINLSAYGKDWNEGKGWAPIGNASTDINGNGEVDGTDVLWILRFVASGRSVDAMKKNYTTPGSDFSVEAADFNNDGAIDGADVLWIQRYVACGRNVDAMLRAYNTETDFSHLY